MLSRYKWYRRWRGGYWVYTHFFSWRKVNEPEYCLTKYQRGNKPKWSFECYETIDPHVVKHPAPKPWPLGDLHFTKSMKVMWAGASKKHRRLNK